MDAAEFDRKRSGRGPGADEEATGGTGGDGRPWPTRPALVAACAIAAGVVLAAWLVRAAGGSAEAGSTGVYGAGCLAAVLAVGVVLLLLVGTVEVMFKRRASRAGMVAGMSFLAAGALLLAASPAFLAGFCALLYGLPVCGFAGLYRAGAADVGTLPAAAIALVYMLASFWLVMALWNYALSRPEAAGWRLLALPEAVLSRLGVCSSGDIAGAVRAIAAEKAAKDAPWFYYC